MSGLNMALGRGAPGLRPCGKGMPMPLPAARRPFRGATYKTSAVMQAELAPAATARAVIGGGVDDPVTVAVPPGFEVCCPSTSCPCHHGLSPACCYACWWSSKEGAVEALVLL
jgi:hypothetical protein